MGYRIGSFNIRDFNFSNQTSDNERIQRDFHKIAEIIIREKFDVIAVQEVNAEIAIKYLTTILNLSKTSAREYAYDFGADMPTHSKDPERYGFIWNTKRLRLREFPYKKNPQYYINAGGTQLQRPAYYARFTARGLLGGSNFELRLINVHIKDASSEAERIREFDILVKQVLPRICDLQGVSSDLEMMPAYTFLLGDYNLALNKGPRAQIKIETITKSQYTGKSRYFITVQEDPTSLRLPSEQETIEECYANNYDHFTYETDLDTKLDLQAERVDALTQYILEESDPIGKLESYRKKVSDHVPIKMDISLIKHRRNTL